MSIKLFLPAVVSTASPIRMLWLPLVMVLPASQPNRTLPVPLVTPAPAPMPTPTFLVAPAIETPPPLPRNTLAPVVKSLTASIRSSIFVTEVEPPILIQAGNGDAVGSQIWRTRPVVVSTRSMALLAALQGPELV